MISFRLGCMLIWLHWQSVNANKVKLLTAYFEGTPINGRFRAATYDHIRIGDNWILDNPNIVDKFMLENLKVINRTAQLASKNGVKVLVTPEIAIYPPLQSRRDVQNGFAVQIPSIGTTVCRSAEDWTETSFVNRSMSQMPKSNDKILLKIACIAQQNQLYLAVNVPELEFCATSSLRCHRDGYNVYNTVVVFNGSGTLVAKYQKYHLFKEPVISRPSSPQTVAFDTEFGRFGIIICFDVMFKQPLHDLVYREKIDHLIFSTAWFDKFPLLNAITFHPAIALHYRINVISSNLRNLGERSFGSSISSAVDGIQVQTDLQFLDLVMANLSIPCPTTQGKMTHSQNNTFIIREFEAEDETLILNKHHNVSSSVASPTSDLHKIVEFNQTVYGSYSDLLKGNRGVKKYRYLSDQLNKFTHRRLESSSGKIQKLCHESVCCSLSWKMEPTSLDDTYYLVVVNRLRTKSFTPWYEQACSMISYSEADDDYRLMTRTRFRHLRLTGWFDSDVSFPSILRSELKVLPYRHWNYIQSNTTAQISFHDVDEPIAFASIYTRVFEKDSQGN